MKKIKTYMPPLTEIVACEVEKEFALNVSGLDGLTDQND